MLQNVTICSYEHQIYAFERGIASTGKKAQFQKFHGQTSPNRTHYLFSRLTVIRIGGKEGGGFSDMLGCGSVINDSDKCCTYGEPFET